MPVERRLRHAIAFDRRAILTSQRRRKPLLAAPTGGEIFCGNHQPRGIDMLITLSKY